MDKSESYPVLEINNYLKFLGKLGFVVVKGGKGSHKKLLHKKDKYSPLIIPNRKQTDHYFWRQLEKSLNKDKDWILDKLIEYKFIKK